MNEEEVKKIDELLNASPANPYRDIPFDPRRVADVK